MKTQEDQRAKEQVQAIALHEALARVDILAVPVMSRDRHISRKEQAKLARELFKRLGLCGISVTAPNYSMAQSVDVKPPRRRDYKLDDNGQVENYLLDPAGKANQVARQRLDAVLLAAFPRHEDRSDTQSDYFDYCWSIE